jgi:cytochrome b561
LRSTPSRYGAITQAFHWLTAVLVVAAYLLSKGDRYSLYSAEADAVRRMHETLGVLVVLVVALRLLWAWFDDAPARRPMPRWTAAAAGLVRFALYALVISIPATAVLGTWLEGIPITLAGMDIVPPMSQARGWGQLIMGIHTALGGAILWLAGAHAAAALFHHFCLRDGVLKAMLPGNE